jgi:hypothetical protein
MESEQQLLAKLRNLELDLNSSRVQLKFEQEPDPNIRNKFFQDRRDIVIAREKLENDILGKFVPRLKQLEEDINDGIADLEKALDNLTSTISTLKILNRVTGLVARVLMLV